METNRLIKGDGVVGLFGEVMKAVAKEVVNELSDVHPKEQQEETLQEKNRSTTTDVTIE